MIVVLDNSGRLCNRLVLFAHACATAFESKQWFYHLMAEDVLRFVALEPKILREFKVVCKSKIPGLSFLLRLRQAFYERIRPFNKVRYLSGNFDRAQRMSRRSFLPHILLYWYYRDPAALLRQRENICRLLTPKKEYTIAPKSFAGKLRLSACKIVGVHIRRGDYREFQNGRYFFSNEEYSRFIKQTSDTLAKECKFVIVSDEPLDEPFFSNIGVHIFRGKDFREDLVMLSLCDYILGPWSSFSWWAAYYGHAKLCHLHGRDDVVAAESFHEITGQEL